MSALRRVLLSLWGLVCAAAAVLMAVMLVNSSVAASVINFLDKCFLYNMRQAFIEENGIWLAIIIGLVLLAFGIFCIVVALMPKPVAKKLRVATVEGGAVDIGLTALYNIVKKAASSTQGVKSVEPDLQVKNNGLHVELNITLDSEHSVPQVGNIVSDEVKNQLEAMAGIVPADVRVVVTEVAEQKEEGVTIGN